MKFSIILPVKNGGHFVKECVHSILSQTLQEFNLLILDSGSNDGTLEWLFSLNDKRIIIYESNKALSIEENWSRIKDIPKNEFITLIGHDDLLDTHYLETMKSLIQEHPKASLYQSHFSFIDEKGNLLRECLPMEEIQFAHEFLASFMRQSIDSTGTGYMMRSVDYDSLGGIDPTYPKLLFADYALWIDMIHLSYKATSNQNAFKYRMHSSVSKAAGGQEYKDAFEKFVYFIKSWMTKDDKIKISVENYGKQMLIFYCESISHRLLKTDPKLRNISVGGFIKECRNYASMLIPGQKFFPESKLKVMLAKIFDHSSTTRKLFIYFKKYFI